MHSDFPLVFRIIRNDFSYLVKDVRSLITSCLLICDINLECKPITNERNHSRNEFSPIRFSPAKITYCNWLVAYGSFANFRFGPEPTASIGFCVNKKYLACGNSISRFVIKSTMQNPKIKC